MDEAEQLFNRIAEALTRECANETIVDTGSLCPIPHVLDIIPNRFTQVVSDTPKREYEGIVITPKTDVVNTNRILKALGLVSCNLSTVRSQNTQ